MFAPPVPASSAWIGGAENRGLRPPRADGALAPAKTRHPSPFAAVVQPALKRARPSEGSNTTIPVGRVVQTAHAIALGKGVPITPTEHLREGQVAFILGKRATKKRTMPNDAEGLHVLAGMLSSAHATRFSQLCSLPFLQAYFDEVLCGETIALDAALPAIVGALPPSVMATGGPLGTLTDAARRARMPGVAALGGGDPGALAGLTLDALPDYGRRLGFRDSDAADAPERYQGILARDLGAFLRGKGGEDAALEATKGGLPLAVPGGGGGVIAPHRVARNLGDAAAFAAFDALLVDHGFTEFRPDGLVKSKFDNVPDDPIEDNALDQRDGALWNIAVQGPAAAGSWTGEPSMAVGTMDKVLILLIGDIWFDAPEANEPLLQPGAIDSAEKRKAYLQRRAAALAPNPDAAGVDQNAFDEAAFRAKQATAFQGRGARAEATRLTNVRVVASTTAQLVNHSRYRAPTPTATGLKPTTHLTGGSRLGLQICNEFREAVIGGWVCGSVLDTSLSRATIPPGANLQARSGANTSLSKVDVNIRWASADALFRAYSNTQGQIAQRFEKPVPTRELNTVNARLATAALINERLNAEGVSTEARAAATFAKGAAIAGYDAVERTTLNVDPASLSDAVKEAVAAVREGMAKATRAAGEAEAAAVAVRAASIGGAGVAPAVAAAIAAAEATRQAAVEAHSDALNLLRAAKLEQELAQAEAVAAGARKLAEAATEARKQKPEAEREPAP